MIALFKTVDPVIWWATSVEIASALARLLKTMHVDLREYQRARGAFAHLAASWSVIQPSENLLSEATDMVERYDLRAGDAFQLAAALMWCEHKPKQRLFISLDEKLRESSVICGFEAPQF